MSGKRLDVGSVAGEDSAAWLSDGDHECIDGRAGTGTSAEFGCSAGNVHADGRFNDARLQEAVVFASRPASPCSDSTSTIVGTSGGHSSCAVNARMSETDVFVRAARRESPPLSRTSTFS